MFNEYTIPYDRINEIAGFDYTQYFKKDQIKEDYNFLSYSKGIFCEHDYGLNLYAEDLNEEILDEYKIKDNACTIMNLNIYLTFLVKNYIDLSSEEPLMHKSILEHDLEHIKQIKNILKVLE